MSFNTSDIKTTEEKLLDVDNYTDKLSLLVIQFRIEWREGTQTMQWPTKLTMEDWQEEFDSWLAMQDTDNG
jgi:hypothetical protein